MLETPNILARIKDKEIANQNKLHPEDHLNKT